MARPERESDSRSREKKWQSCWCCRDQQRACRMAINLAEKLERTGPVKKERVASVALTSPKINRPRGATRRGRSIRLPLRFCD